jgi:sugar phosphate permease
VLGARFSARWLLAGGLAATAATNLAFGASSALPVLCGLWGLNGMLQVGAAGWMARLAR